MVGRGVGSGPPPPPPPPPPPQSPRRALTASSPAAVPLLRGLGLPRLGAGRDQHPGQNILGEAEADLRPGAAGPAGGGHRESGDVKATIAVLSFILSSAAKHNVDSESLSSELQQLGLPKEHASGLCRSYEEKQSPLQDRLRACSLRLSQLGSVHWRVDYTLSSSELQEVNEPVVHLTFNVRDREGDKMTAVPVTLSANKFWVLLAELKQAQTLMNTLL
uniref:COMM domain containing 4 n=1 Tax=Ficedula albicollis TaxID=59894 RepID=A0A803V171_FICAL